MRNEQDFVYELLHQGLLKGDSMDAATASHRLDQVNLPGDLLAKVDAYLLAGGSDDLVELALATVRSYFLSGTFPDRHLLLVAYLLWAKKISPDEACRLAILDASNVSAMTDAAKGVVLRAEAIAEEAQMEFMCVGDDNALEECLLEFSAAHGLQWGRFDPPIGVATLRFQRTNS